MLRKKIGSLQTELDEARKQLDFFKQNTRLLRKQLFEHVNAHGKYFLYCNQWLSPESKQFPLGLNSTAEIPDLRLRYQSLEKDFNRIQEVDFLVLVTCSHIQSNVSVLIRKNRKN